MKKITQLKDKDTGQIYSYSSLAELTRDKGVKVLGIGLHSLYNVLCKQEKWEGKRYEISRVSFDIGKTEW